MSKQRVVIVTGGGSGIGLAIAQTFADAGDHVYIIGRSKDKLETVARTNQNLTPVVADVTDASSVEKAKTEIAKQHKTVDVLINCAGGGTKIDPDAGLAEATEGWEFVLDVNLSGPFRVIYAFLPMISKPGGRIINISSLAAFTGSTNSGVGGQAYAAAKSGLHGMSRTLAKALARDGITVNCVAPGVIDDTGFFGGDGVPEDRRDRYLAAIPEGRLGQPEDIAPGVFYLASDQAAFITGEVLNINGGQVFGR